MLVQPDKLIESIVRLYTLEIITQFWYNYMCVLQIV